MGTKRKPSLDDAGRITYSVLTDKVIGIPMYNELKIHDKKKYIKLAIEIWQEVEKCI